MNAIILSGGKASRIGGKEKAFLKLADKTFIETQIGLLKKIFGRIIVVTNTPQLYRNLGINIVTDQIKGLGPLMGLYTGLKASNKDYNFVTASDTPFLQKAVIIYLKENADGFDGIVPKWEKGPQPLCAVYSRRCIPFIEEVLDKGRIISFYKYANIEFVPEAVLRRLDPQGLSFFNVNTISDYRRIYSCIQ